MAKHAKNEATAAEAVKHLTNLAVQFNDSAVHAESAAKMMKAMANFIERQEVEKQQLQYELESVKLWVDTVQKLLTRADDLAAANKSSRLGPSSAARGNIEMALGILSRLKDPDFAASRKKKPAAPSVP